MGFRRLGPLGKGEEKGTLFAKAAMYVVEIQASKSAEDITP